MTRSIVNDMPAREQALSEHYRIAANRWCELDAVARRLEELKTTALEQKKNALVLREGPIPDSHAERRIKATPEWEAYIVEMVEARTAANRARIEMDAIRMREREIADRNAGIRAEMRMAR